MYGLVVVFAQVDLSKVKSFLDSLFTQLGTIGLPFSGVCLTFAFLLWMLAQFFPSGLSMFSKGVITKTMWGSVGLAAAGALAGFLSGIGGSVKF